VSSLQERLKNLQKIGQIKAEPPDQAEFHGLVKSAKEKLPDAEKIGLSAGSSFLLAYRAAHSLSLAALRWHGYRPSNRIVVFQLLGDTLSFPTSKWRFLENCHHKRNVAEYEGDDVDDESLIRELIAVTKELQTAVEALGPIRV